MFKKSILVLSVMTVSTVANAQLLNKLSTTAKNTVSSVPLVGSIVGGLIPVIPEPEKELPQAFDMHSPEVGINMTSPKAQLSVVMPTSTITDASHPQYLPLIKKRNYEEGLAVMDELEQQNNAQP